MCSSSAGYVWCASRNKCLPSFHTECPTTSPVTTAPPVPSSTPAPPVPVPVPLVTSTFITTVINPKCSDAGSSEEYGGDCSATPTYCGRDRYGPRPPGQEPPPPAPRPDDFWENVVSCRYMGRYGEKDIPPNSDDAHLCYDKRCSREVGEEFPDWCASDFIGRFGGYRGSCSGTNNCLNLNFHCAEGEYCEMICTGGNSCEGLTIHCADNRVCLLRCQSYFGDSCVNAEVKCGEGTVAQSDGYNHGCVLADTADDCYKPIIPPGTTHSPTTPRTSAPTTSPTDPFILTPTITYTCVGVTCSDGFDGSTCGSDGGCCPFGDTPSDGQCSCGTSWSDANVNKIPCKLTQQQPEPES